MSENRITPLRYPVIILLIFILKFVAENEKRIFRYFIIQTGIHICFYSTWVKHEGEIV